MKRFLYTISLFVLVNCVPSLTEKERTQLYDAGIHLMHNHPQSRLSYSTGLPPEIKDLGPSRVYLRDEGLYIVTFSFFVEEHGFFIPRPKNNENNLSENGDPSYKHIGNGVYRFRIKG
ncbi:MAG: hypothetical protein F9K24_04270 [Leptonema illini]|uniref:Uncharacterized protein n=1 Tax=Leptonema illini TaxID=183 RepID=A0A833H3U1_9LEPT|nr:MAG: hypothetical protein F9K24_04270 [Leptonema illini]